MYILILSKENIDLAQAEVQSLSKQALRFDDLMLLPHAPQGLALTKSIWQVLWSGKLTNFSLKNPLIGSFAARTHNLDISISKLASLIWQEQLRHKKIPTVDLKNPDNLITFFNINDIYYAAALTHTQESFEERKAHKRPHNHPTSLHPKLARTMINLAGTTQTILDPFCGSGGILIEGSLIGKEMIGTDIDPIQIRRAQDNLKAFNQQAMLTIANANDCAQFAFVDAIVTDVPLGKNAKLPELNFSQFFIQAKKTTSKMVLGALQERPIDVSPWTIKQEFSWYIHKTMTKRILVLE